MTKSIKALKTVQLVNNLTVTNKTHRKGNVYLLSLIRSPFTESIDSYNESPLPSPTHQLQNETETETEKKQQLKWLTLHGQLNYKSLSMCKRSQSHANFTKPKSHMQESELSNTGIFCMTKQ